MTVAACTCCIPAGELVALAGLREDAIRRIDAITDLLDGLPATVTTHAIRQHLTVANGALRTHRRLDAGAGEP